MKASEATRERPSERSIERASQRAIERAIERVIERATERTSDRAIERTTERKIERAIERASDRVNDRANARASDRASLRLANPLNSLRIYIGGAGRRQGTPPSAARANAQSAQKNAERAETAHQNTESIASKPFEFLIYSICFGIHPPSSPRARGHMQPTPFEWHFLPLVEK